MLGGVRAQEGAEDTGIIIDLTVVRAVTTSVTTGDEAPAAPPPNSGVVAARMPLTNRGHPPSGASGRGIKKTKDCI